MYTRKLQDRLIALSRNWSVISLTGPRQSGKTTLCKMAFPTYDYVNLEDIAVRSMVQSDIKAFLLSHRNGLIVDEAQYLPEIFSAIQVVVDELKSTAVVVSTTGMISRELFEYREQKNQGHGADFLTVGSMGHASQIALTIALQKPDRKVYVFDGDGALLMHMGGMAIIGDYCPKNMVHIVFNNGAHDSVGGQPTVGHKIDIPAIAKAVGYTDVLSVDSESELKSAMKHLEDVKQTGVALINVIVCKGNRPDLGRPTTTPIQNKLAFMSNIKH